MRVVAYIVALIIGVCGVLFGSLPAAAASCKEGYVWVDDPPSVKAEEQSVVGADFVATKGRCVKKQGAQGRKAAAALQRRCALEDAAVARALVTGEDYIRSDECQMVSSASINFSEVARSLIVRLRLPDANPRFGPNPNNNEWKMLAVGFPVWLWTDGPRHKEATASAYGVTFRLVADLASTTFTTGDGGQVTCTSMSTYATTIKPGSPSPTCGYVYTKPSLPKGAYTVTATPQWRIRWSAGGFSGTLTTSYSDSSQIRIGELRALNR